MRETATHYVIVAGDTCIAQHAKPLTAFEVFKAGFESALSPVLSPSLRQQLKDAFDGGPIEERARLAFADDGNPNAGRNRDFFFHAFDTWVSVVPGTEMRKLFGLKGDDGDALPLLVSTSADLFGACISKYGTNGFARFAAGSMATRLVIISPQSRRRRLRSGVAHLTCIRSVGA